MTFGELPDRFEPVGQSRGVAQAVDDWLSRI